MSGSSSLLLTGVGKAASAAFSPSDLAGLQVWLKDTGLSGSDGDPVATWTNAGAAGNFAQSTGAAKPTKKTAILNGRDVCRFDGVDDFLTAGDLSAAFPSAATMFIVCTLNGDSFYGLYETNNSACGTAAYSAVGYWFQFRANPCDNSNNNHPATMPTSGSHRFAVRSSASAWEGWKDAVSQGSRAADFGSGTLHRLAVDGSSSFFLDGDIAEVIVYDSALSDANVLSVHNYLATRFGL